jgi:ribosomal protein S24E
LQLEKKSQSKVLDRSYVEAYIEDKAGRFSRKEAIALVAQELGVPAENVALVRMDGQSGTTNLLGKFYVYGSAQSKNRVHPKYLEERMLTKAERDKLKQDRKRAAAPAAQPEAKK